MRKVKRAQILLHANEDKTDKAAAEALHVATATVFRMLGSSYTGFIHRHDYCGHVLEKPVLFSPLTQPG